MYIMAEYTYLITDFTNGINPSQFHMEILASNITVDVVGITCHDDDVHIAFESNISGSEQTTLDTLVANHVPSTSKPKNKFYTICPKTTTITSTNYFAVGSSVYRGSANIGPIDYIEIIANKDSLATSYDLRVVNKSTGDVIASKTGNTNTSLTAIDLGTISNIPENNTLLEIQVRKNGLVGSAEISEIIIYYDN